MIHVLTHWKAKRTLTKAKQAYNKARKEWDAAEDRQDTRRMSVASADLRQAMNDLLRAEGAVRQ